MSSVIALDESALKSPLCATGQNVGSQYRLPLCTLSSTPPAPLSYTRLELHKVYNTHHARTHAFQRQIQLTIWASKLSGIAQCYASSQHVTMQVSCHTTRSEEQRGHNQRTKNSQVQEEAVGWRYKTPLGYDNRHVQACAHVQRRHRHCGWQTAHRISH